MVGATRPSTPIRLILAEDDQFIRVRLRALLEHEPDLQVVAAVADGKDALTLTRALLPDVLVLDEHMPGALGSDVAEALAHEGIRTRVVVYSAESRAVGSARNVKVSFVANDERLTILLAEIRSAD
jgi:DNA-binding NarL/FixJ family response regulator